MLKLLSQISIAVLAISPKARQCAIASVVVGTVYLMATQVSNDIMSDRNMALANDNLNQATLVNVWDQENEPNYSGTTEMTVYRSPSCGCCGAWLEHATKHGFQIQDIKTEEMETIKQQYNIPTELASCHTAIIDGYIMEGHIPADDIKRFLAEKPAMTGLAVPGMPIGTPGMEVRDIKQPFQVLAFNDQGKIEVFNEYQSY